jgi:hypothetical protein
VLLDVAPLVWLTSNWTVTVLESVSVFFKSVKVTFAITCSSVGSLIVVFNSYTPPFFLALKPSGNDVECISVPFEEYIFISPLIFSSGSDLSSTSYLTDTLN